MSKLYKRLLDKFKANKIPVLNWFYHYVEYLEPLKDYEYLCNFGFSLIKGELVLRDKEKLEKAFDRAWENRDFEINKFWSRAAYFWGFIALIFAGYLTLIANNKFILIKNPYVELYIICMGVLFSIAWCFVILGSKRWQTNWEAHIDRLENFVSGPIYKTLHHRSLSYSVSKINLVLSLIVISVWLGFLYDYLSANHFLPGSNLASNNINWHVVIPLILTLLFGLMFSSGYCKGSTKTQKHKFYRRDYSEY